MIRTYKDAVKFLEEYIPDQNKKFPGSLGLERMKYLCELLGNPQYSYKTIHVGGTSGKGSTATIIASILSTKYKVGLHTSPHLVQINERMRIFSRGDDISDRELIQLINEVRPRIEMVESQFGKPTYFEITTALAFMYFFRQKVDYAVIEVGMGGRYDGTNVIQPVVAVLTNVGLDHTEILGDTVEKIATDKVGIIKRGIQVASGVSKPSVVKIVEVACNKKNASLSLLHRDFGYGGINTTDRGSRFDYIGYKKYSGLFLRLLGRHQVENAAIALRAIEISNIQYPISNTEIREGLKNVFIPGRLEIIKRNPLIILDGAHNPDKVNALIDAVRTIFPKKRVIAVVAIKKDKNAKDMITPLFQIANELVFTEYRVKTDLGNTVSYKAEELRDLCKQLNNVTMKQCNNVQVSIERNVFEAGSSVMEKAGHNDLILVTGSLYLIGELRKNFQ